MVSPNTPRLNPKSVKSIIKSTGASLDCNTISFQPSVNFNSPIIKFFRTVTSEDALKVVAVQREFGCFDAFIWGFVGGKPVQNSFGKLGDLPTETKQSRDMSKELKKRGFQFVDPTICYAFMQATGMVNDHITTCFRHKQITAISTANL